MSIVLEAPRAEKKQGRRRTPQRYTPQIKFAEQPAKPARLPSGGPTVKPVLMMDARRQFFASLPKFTERVLTTDARYAELEALAAERRHFRYGVSIDIGATLGRLRSIRQGLIEAFAGSLANTLWKLEGSREVAQLPPRWPNLDRSQLWAAGMVGLGNALDRGVVIHFHKLLYQCVLHSCGEANARAIQPRILKPRGYAKKLSVREAAEVYRDAVKAGTSAMYFEPVAGGFALLND